MMQADVDNNRICALILVDPDNGRDTYFIYARN